MAEFGGSELIHSGDLVNLTAEKTEETNVLWKIGMVARKSELQQLSCAAGLKCDWVFGLEIDSERHHGSPKMLRLQVAPKRCFEISRPQQ